MRTQQFFIATALTLCISACAGLSSTKLGAESVSSDSKAGLVYFMPTTRILLVVAVNDKEGQIKVQAGEPVYVADEDHGYRLSTEFSPTHAEVASLTVNQGGLLTSANLKSTGQLGEIAAGIGKTFGVFESAFFKEGDREVYERWIDVYLLTLPTKKPQSGLTAIDELNRDVQAALATVLRESKSAYLKRAAEAANEGKEVVHLTVERDFPSARTGSASAEDCSVGFCYRMPVGYEFTASFFDGAIKSATFRVPNGSPIYAAAVERGVFATWDTKATLVNGMLQSYARTTESSEGLELATLGPKVVGAVVDGVTLGGRLFDARKTRIQSEISLLQEQEKLKETRQKRAQAENAASGRPLFELTGGNSTARTGQTLFRGPMESQAPGPSTNEGETVGPSGTTVPGHPGSGQ